MERTSEIDKGNFLDGRTRDTESEVDTWEDNKGKNNHLISVSHGGGFDK